MNKLFQIRKFLGLTQKQLADLLGVGQNTISQIENNIISLTDRNKHRLAERLNVNLRWIETGEGEIVCDEETAHAQLPANKLPEHAETILRRTSSAPSGQPYINIPITNGVANEHSDIMDVTPEFKVDFFPFSDVTFYRPIVGDSMLPKIKAGDIVACKRDPHHNSIQFGETYLCLANLNGQKHEYLRVIRKHTDEKLIILRALNDNFDDIVILISNIIELYIIKGIIRRFM